MRKDARSPLEMEGQIGFSGNVQDSSFSSVITSYDILLGKYVTSWKVQLYKNVGGVQLKVEIWKCMGLITQV